MSVRKPCPSCPWLVENDASVIPGFSLDLAERLEDTTGTELGAPAFACHQSREGKEVHCAGWLARYGWNNIGVRLSMIAGRIHPDQLDPGEDWPKTHETFAEVIEKLRATA